MKFSVWDYSQIKIAQFNDEHPDLAIDPTDIFIFTWFKGFATKTRSKIIRKDGTAAKRMWSKTIDGVDYFNVRYEAIIKDFPILSFSSIKSIQRRFDKYVEAGIFEKKIIHAGKHGNFTYFAFTELFWSFEYNNDNPEHKQVGEDNFVQTKQLGADNFVQTKQLGADNSVQTLLNNPTISLNNPATTSSNSNNFDNKTKQDFSEKSEEEVFLETIKTLFGYNPCFNPNPYPLLITNFQDCNLKNQHLAEYLNWIFNELKTKCKNLNNFPSYFFKSFAQPVYISMFAHKKEIEEQRIADKEANKIICPVCGFAHDKNDFFCPNGECRLSKEQLESPEDVAREKALYILKKNDFERYSEYLKQYEALATKYPMVERFRDKEKQKEFDNLFSELESKFLNIKKAS